MEICLMSAAARPSLEHKVKGMNPQISLTFDAKHHGLHKDIYELFCHSQEAMGIGQ